MDDLSFENIDFLNLEINIATSKGKTKNENIVSIEKIFYSFYNKSFYFISKI